MAYVLNDGKNKFSLQICESPFRGELQEEMLAYNLMWTGTHDWFSTLYSVNFVEYLPVNS